MRAMVFETPGRPLKAVELPVPEPGPGQLLLRVHACGICRTDLHLLDGEVDVPAAPLALVPQVPVRTHVTSYPLEQANEALADLRAGRFTGAGVLVP